MKSKDRVLLTFALVAMLGLSSCSRPDYLAKFQGDWIFTEFNSEGDILSAKALKVMSAKIENNSFKMYAGNKLGDDYTISVNGATVPTEIDLVHASGEDQGKKELGIYYLEGNRLKLCIAGSGAPRPTQFVAPERSGQTIIVLERKTE